MSNKQICQCDAHECGGVKENGDVWYMVLRYHTFVAVFSHSFAKEACAKLEGKAFADRMPDADEVSYLGRQDACSMECLAEIFRDEMAHTLSKAKSSKSKPKLEKKHGQ